MLGSPKGSQWNLSQLASDQDFTGIVQAENGEELIMSKYWKHLLNKSDSVMWLWEQLEVIAVMAQRSKKKTDIYIPGQAFSGAAVQHSARGGAHNNCQNYAYRAILSRRRKEVSTLLNHICDSAVSRQHHEWNGQARRCSNNGTNWKRWVNSLALHEHVKHDAW